MIVVKSLFPAIMDEDDNDPPSPKFSEYSPHIPHPIAHRGAGINMFVAVMILIVNGRMPTMETF